MLHTTGYLHLSLEARMQGLVRDALRDMLIWRKLETASDLWLTARLP